MMINPFLDNRPRPQITLTTKIKIFTENKEETILWNNTFSRIIKFSEKNKLEYISVAFIRDMKIKNITLNDIKPFINENYYNIIKPIENIFNNKIPSDIKALIIAFSQIPLKDLQNIISLKEII